jgi:hypothetical protein
MSQVKPQKKKPYGDLPIPQAIAILKDEICEEVKRVATGLQHSIYSLMEKGRELAELESEHAKATPQKSSAPSRKGSKATPKSEDAVEDVSSPIRAEDF